MRDLVDTGVLELDDHAILVHLTAAQALLYGEGRVTGIELRLEDPGDAPLVARDVMHALNEDLPMTLYRTTTWKEQGAGLVAILRQARMIISLVLGLIIVMAGSTLVMSLLLLVRRRRHDIAVFASMGAEGRALFWVFETIGAATGLLGAGFGILLGSVTCLCLWTLRFPLADGIYPVEFLPVAYRPPKTPRRV